MKPRVVYELAFEAHRSAKVASNMFKGPTREMTVLDFTASDTVAAGKVRADLEADRPV